MRISVGSLLSSVALSISPVAVASPPAAALSLSYPLQCETRVTCIVQNYLDIDPGPGVHDYLCGQQTYQGHNGVDFRISDMAAQHRGVAVLAVAPGVVMRTRDEAPDISMHEADAPSVLGRECGNGLIVKHRNGWETQYCHMAHGSISVKAGQAVSRGSPLGLVGLSGMTEFPHLHLTLRHNGIVVDPFGPKLGTGRCSSIPAASLWDGAARLRLSYRVGAVLNFGFSNSLVSMPDVEEAKISPADLRGRFLIGYVRAIHLRAGDIQVLTIRGPQGVFLASTTLPALELDKAQSVSYTHLTLPTIYSV